MAQETAAPGRAGERRALARGALLRSAGALAGVLRALVPIAFLRLFSSEAYGVYVVCFALVDLLQRGIVTGFSDALVYFAARHDGAARAASGEAREGAERRLAGAAATALGAAAALALLGVVALELGADWIYALYARTQPASLVPALRLMALLLPLQVLLALPLAALRARLRLEYELVIQSILQPLVVLALAVALRHGTGQQESPLLPALAWVGGTALAASAASAAYVLSFGLRPTLQALRRLAPDRELLAYALPQSASMMASFGLERVSPLLLGAFAAPAVVAHYAVASELARVLRTLRLSLSGVFGPLVARQQGAGDRGGIQHAFDLVTSWIAMATLPAVFALLALRRELFLIYDQPAPGPYFAVLIAGTFLNGAYGLAGTVLLMTGRARRMLAISGGAAALNIALGLVLVPRLGMLGAALASSAAMLGQVIAQQLSARRLEGLGSPAGAWRAPLRGGLALGLGALALLALPPGVLDGRLAAGALAPRLAVVVAALGGYAWIVRKLTASGDLPADGPGRPAPVS